MRDVGARLGAWGVGLQEDPSDDHSTVLVNEDSGAESESNEADQSNFFEVPHPSGISSVVSVTVGLPTRFGNPNEEGSEAAMNPFPECSINSNLRDILKKVTVNESALHAAIERLGRGTTGLKAVSDYVKFFLESRDPGDVNPEAFTRGLKQFCLHYGEAKEGTDNKCPPQESGRQDARTDVQVRGQEDWARNVHGREPFSMGYDMSGYFPNFCYPYPPPFAGYAPYTMGVQPMYMPMMGVPYFSPPVQENVHTNDAMTRASRRSRIERRRVHGSDHLQPRSTVKPAHVTAVRSGRLENTTNQSLAVAPAGEVCFRFLPFHGLWYLR